MVYVLYHIIWCLTMSNWKVNRYGYRFWKPLVQFSGNNFTGQKRFKTQHCAATATQKEQIWRNKWFKLTQSWSLLVMQKLCEMTTLRDSANSFGYISWLMGDLLELTLKSVRNFWVTIFIHEVYFIKTLVVHASYIFYKQNLLCQL